MPRWLRLDESQLRALSARAGSLHLPGVELVGRGPGVARLSALVDMLLALSPAVERLALDIHEGQLRDVRELAYRLPQVRMVVSVYWRPTLDDRAVMDELRALPHVKVEQPYGDW